MDVCSGQAQIARFGYSHYLYAGHSLKRHSTHARETSDLLALGNRRAAVEVEVDISASAQPKTILVGLPEATVRESIHRIDRAIVNSGFIAPQDRIVINLAPAELPKQAASFDLPISLGLLAASGQMPMDKFSEYAIVGELSLDGITRPVKGMLSIAIEQQNTRVCAGLLCPRPMRLKRLSSKGSTSSPWGA